MSSDADSARPAQQRGFSAWVKYHWIISILIAVAGIGIIWVMVAAIAKPKKKPPPPAPTPVAVGSVKLGDIDVYYDALGTVTPVYTVTVASRVAGELTQVLYKEGELVKKNQVLAIVDPRPYQAVLLQSQGQLARDDAALKNARIDLVRYQNAYKDHAIPQQQLATQQATIDQDEGTVKVDQGNLAAAQVNVDYTRIVSPIDGRVGLRLVDPGNIVPANGATGIAVITQQTPITVIFTIAEDSLGDVIARMNDGSGQPLPVQAFDRSKQHQLAQGTLLTVDNQINTTTGTVRARASFANTHSELFPNQFVNARLLVKTLKQVNVAPEAAIQRNNDNAYVYVVQTNNTVKMQSIKVVATDGGSSAVTGVNLNDQLVTDGFDKLSDGSKIVLRKPTSKDAGSDSSAGGQKTE